MKRVMAVVALAMASVVVQADSLVFQTEGFSAGARLSSLGLGVEGTFKLNETTNIRVSLDRFGLTDNINKDGVNYEQDAKVTTFGVLADWYPFKGRFRVSAGAMANNGAIELQAVCNQLCGIGKNGYTSATVNPGKLKADIDVDVLSPYVGVGWVYTFSNQRTYLALDAGALLQQKRDVSLTASGDFNNQNGTKVSAGSSAFQADLQLEQQNIQQDLDDTKALGLLGVMVGYRF